MNWLSLLDKAIRDEGSQSKVAARLGYSPSTISLVIADQYPGDIYKFSQKVREVYGGKAMQELPQGYMRNRVGHLVPMESVKEIDVARDEFVRDIITKALDTSSTIRAFKKEVADDMQAFFELSAEKYDAAVDQTKGFLELYSYDGQYKIVREFAERLDTNERVQVARELILECLREWSEVAGPELKTIVEKKLQVNKKGKINIKEYLSLRSLAIDHPKWKKAMEAVSDSVVVAGTCIYYRMYERNEEGKYNQISLDFSGI